MIPLLFVLVFPILLILVFVIPGIFLLFRWFSILATDDSATGAMTVPTFYSSRSMNDAGVPYFFMMPFVGVVFGGIHCIGWFFNFPSSVEAMLWRVSSAVLTGIAFLSPLLTIFMIFLVKAGGGRISFATVILLVYIVSRLLLLVEAFISLRHLTPGMLALVKWTSFIPHI